jgi:hypothetical protein
MAPIKTNNPYASYFDFFSRSGTDASSAAPPGAVSGLTATGGVISDYESGGNTYRAHIFTSSGALNVTALGNLPASVEYLVVAGGGGGGAQGAGSGGGGAGGLRTNLSGHPLAGAAFPVTAGPTSYTVTVGGGANGGSGTGYGNHGSRGTNSVFGPGPITSTGGGGGGASSGGSNPVGPGGSGGGRGGAEPGSAYTGNTPPVSPSQGFAGGIRPANYYAGGGGGAGAVGQNGQSDRGGAGGAGVQVAIAGPTATTFTGVGAKNPANNQYQYFAGGGGGGTYPDASYRSDGGVGGGGDSGYSPSKNGLNATYSTGGGGGGAAGNGPLGGSGASGIVVVRYQIAASQTGTAKATGGAISYYGGKTIHAFTGNGTFATTSDWSAATVEYVVIGGGGGGGQDDGGGGGSGAVKIGTTPIGAHPVSTTIQIGAGGEQNTVGTPSYFGTPITAPGGGYGGTEPSPTSGGNGGSGGGGSGGFGAGGAGTGTGNDFPGSSPFVSPSNGWGNDGGAGRTNTGPAPYSGGGGGGASEAGAGASQGNYGGRGMQLSPTFRDPSQNIGAPGEVGYGAPQPGRYFAAGGGGTRTNTPLSGSGAGVGGVGGGGWGGSNPAKPPGTPAGSGTDADVNTGSGGGGGDLNNDAASRGGRGGSGIVLIAYPT